MYPVFVTGSAKAESIVLRLCAPGSMPIHHCNPAGFGRRTGSVFDNGRDRLNAEIFKMSSATATPIVTETMAVGTCALLVKIVADLDRVLKRLEEFAERT